MLPCSMQPRINTMLPCSMVSKVSNETTYLRLLQLATSGMSLEWVIYFHLSFNMHQYSYILLCVPGRLIYGLFIIVSQFGVVVTGLLKTVQKYVTGNEFVLRIQCLLPVYENFKLYYVTYFCMCYYNAKCWYLLPQLLSSLPKESCSSV